jgi:hypothetical protein
LNDGRDNTGVLVLVAAHDEADRIGATLAALRDAFPAASLWVADDGSRDGTAEVASAAGARVVRGERRVGKGDAMTRAVRAALADRGGGDGGGSAATRASTDPTGVAPDGADLGGAGVVLLCDGDLGESAARLVALVQAVREDRADLAVAAFSRRQGGGFGLVVAFARWAIRRRCGFVARAPLSGQRAVRASRLRELLPFAGGYGMEVGMTIDAIRAGARVGEIELDLAHHATDRTPAGFAHRAHQLLDVVRACAARR